MAIEGNDPITGTDRETLRAERHRKVPLRHKLGTVWDTTYAALFLASDESQFVTGVVLPVDGGSADRIG